MSSGTIIGIIWVAIMMVGTLVDVQKMRKEKEKEKQQTAQKPRKQAPAGPILWYEENNAPGPDPMPQIAIKTKSTMRPAPSASRSFSQQTSTLPVEGERVTKPRKATPPVAKTILAQPIESGLHNKENLRRAIILGEILAPKF